MTAKRPTPVVQVLVFKLANRLQPRAAALVATFLCRLSLQTHELVASHNIPNLLIARAL